MKKIVVTKLGPGKIIKNRYLTDGSVEVLIAIGGILLCVEPVGLCLKSNFN